MREVHVQEDLHGVLGERPLAQVVAVLDDVAQVAHVADPEPPGVVRDPLGLVEEDRPGPACLGDGREAPVREETRK